MRARERERTHRWIQLLIADSGLNLCECPQLVKTRQNRSQFSSLLTICEVPARVEENVIYNTYIERTFMNFGMNIQFVHEL